MRNLVQCLSSQSDHLSLDILSSIVRNLLVIGKLLLLSIGHLLGILHLLHLLLLGILLVLLLHGRLLRLLLPIEVGICRNPNCHLTVGGLDGHLVRHLDLDLVLLLHLSLYLFTTLLLLLVLFVFDGCHKKGNAATTALDAPKDKLNNCKDEHLVCIILISRLVLPFKVTFVCAG